jgi:hypothetical protein
MSSTQTETTSYTYSVADIETVMRRFTADIVMMAQSSRAITEGKAREYAYDVELLAKKGYLEKVDITLLSAGVEKRAATYHVDTSAGELTASRPGGVLWPQVPNARLRIILTHSDSYTQTARETMRDKLKTSWGPTNEDTSHTSLASSGNRDYASNGWGLQRKDYTA